MKLVTYLPSGVVTPRLGALLDPQTLVDLQRASTTLRSEPADAWSSLLALLDAGPAALDAARELVALVAGGRAEESRVPLETVRLLSPLPRPRSIRDCLSFEQHLVQATRTVARWKFPPLAWLDASLERLFGRALLAPPRAWYERPIYYKGNPWSVVGPDADVVWPEFTAQLDFELEFGVVIGRGGVDIPERDAGAHIAGYVIFNDFSARDLQLREMAGRLGPAKSKDFDTGNVLGPWLVTPDEVPDPYALEMTARVNGATWTRASSREMHFSFEEMISYISRGETLHPGEFIGSGTAPGGCGLELDRWLSAGDLVELEVTHLGVLRNRVVRPRLPGADHERRRASDVA